MLVRAANSYGLVTVVVLITALPVVGALVDDGHYGEAVVAGAVALIIYAAYVALVRNHLSVSWRTVERNAHRMGTILALLALSVALLDLYLYSVDLGFVIRLFLEQVSHGLGVSLSLVVAGIVSRFALRQLRPRKAVRHSRS